MQTLPNSPALEESPAPHAGPFLVPESGGRRRSPYLLQALTAGMMAIASVFFLLHFLHLNADFPNFAPWMDWSKYTDEGWYGDGAIRHFQTGHWFVAGDFNPAVALPVWPVLEGLLFHFTGVSLVAARALTGVVFGGILLLSGLLILRSGSGGATPAVGLTRGIEQVRRGSMLRSTLPLTAAAALMLLATNPFCYAFGRLAILEPMLVLLMLAALVVAQTAEVPALPAHGLRLRPKLSPSVFQVIGLGVLLPAIVLTKTTGLFLFPAIAWMLFASLGYQWRAFLRVGVPAGAIAATIWIGYFAFLVRPHYLLDYRYLFSANAYTGMTRSNWISAIFYTLHGVAWIGRALTIATTAALLMAMSSPRRLREHPLIVSLILWAAGYGTFLAYHNNLQPRYYLVVVVPLTLLVPVVFHDLVLPRLRTRTVRTAAGIAAAAVAFSIVAPDAVQTVSFVRHPQYTFLSAAQRLNAYIAADRRRDPKHNPLLLSISGSDISLMTGLHSICDDFGSSELEDRVNRYKPGWYASWNLIEDDKMDALTPLFHVERVAAFPAMDDQDRNILILYRLDQGLHNEDGTPHRTHLTGRRFRTKVGQQPSTIQLKH